MRMDFGFYIPKFRHKFFINCQPARCIKNDNVPTVRLCRIHCIPCDMDRIHIIRHTVYGNIYLLSENLQLLDCRGAVYVARRQKRFLAAFLQHKGQLACCRRFTGALQPHQHNHCQSGGRHRNLALRTAQELRQLITDDFDHCLVRLQAPENFFTHRLFTNLGNEIFCNFEIDVRFQKSTAHFTERAVDIALRKSALSP